MTATADWFLRASVELAGTSALQVRWALDVAASPRALSLLETLPREHRQPSLIFSVGHLLGAAEAGAGPFAEWLVREWDRVARVAAVRRTQTNEVGRCAPLVAALDRLPPTPIALIEVGASAGLCLLPDAYAYRFAQDDGGESGRSGAQGLPAEVGLGDGAPVLGCVVSGGPAPRRLPTVAWRRGVDLRPLDPAVDAAWLRALLPPDRPDRLARLDAALATARENPPLIDEGDAVAALPGLLDAVPAGLTPVVAALGTLVYLPPAARSRVLAIARERGAHIVTLEPESALPEIAAARAGLDAPEPTPFLLALDGVPIACVTPHGDRLSWLTPTAPR